MIIGFWARLDLMARNASPAMISIALVLLSVVPLGVPYYGAVAPMLPLIGVYYWAVHRPDLMPLGVVFLIGLFHDLLIGATLGHYALIYLISYWVVYTQRRFLVGRSYLYIWWALAMTASLAAGLDWLIASAWSGRPLSVEPQAFRAMTTTAAFPMVSWMLIQIHRRFVRQI